MHKTLAILAILLIVTPTMAANPTILSGSDASVLGLELAWGRTLRAGSGASLVDVVLHVDETRALKYIDIVEGENLVWRTPVNSLDARTGLPVGEEAVRKAAEREIIFMKARGKTGEIKETIVPHIWLYALGRDGTVQAIDAESGETMWIERVGNPYDPKFNLAVNDEYVVFVSGSVLIQLSATTGSIINVERTETVPIGAPTLAGDYVVLTTTGGGIEGHYAEDITEAPYRGMTAGQAVAKPTRFPKSSMFTWPTTDNYVYCMEAAGTPSEMFRLKAAGAVTGRVETVGADRLFFCSEGGYVYGFKANRLGQLLWQISTGEPMYGDTTVFGENVYAISGSDRLYAFKAEDGSLVWKAPVNNVSRVLGSIGDALLVQDSNDHLTVLSALTGARAATASQSRLHRAIVNRGTDRVYVISDNGYIQCLRPFGRELPEVKVTIEPKKVEVEKGATPATPQPKADPFGAGANDPFGAGNPFDAGGAAPAAGAADPFGAPAGGADPFGAGNPF